MLYLVRSVAMSFFSFLKCCLSFANFSSAYVKIHFREVALGFGSILPKKIISQARSGSADSDRSHEHLSGE